MWVIHLIVFVQLCPWTHHWNESTRWIKSVLYFYFFSTFCLVVCSVDLPCFWLCHHDNLMILSSSGRTWGTGEHLCPDLTAHSRSSRIRPVHSAMGSEEITLAWLQRRALSHFPMRPSRMHRQCSLCDLETTVLRTHTQTHAHTHQLARYQKSPRRVRVTPGFCFLRRLQRHWVSLFSAAHVERWYVLMLNRTQQRIPN